MYNVTLKGQESVLVSDCGRHRTQAKERKWGGLKMEELAAEAHRAARGTGEAVATQSLLRLAAAATPRAGGVKGGGDVFQPGV